MIPLPYKIIGALVAFIALTAAALGYGHYQYVKGDKAGSDRVQSAWNQADLATASLKAKNALEARQREQGLQTQANDQRIKDAETNATLNTRLLAALAELRQRPPRPSGFIGAVPTAPSAGAASGCTGAGLYANDAELLTRLADTSQRVRVQRDACYSAYAAAGKALAEK